MQERDDQIRQATNVGVDPEFRKAIDVGAMKVADAMIMKSQLRAAINADAAKKSQAAAKKAKARRRAKLAKASRRRNR